MPSIEGAGFAIKPVLIIERPEEHSGRCPSTNNLCLRATWDAQQDKE